MSYKVPYNNPEKPVKIIDKSDLEVIDENKKIKLSFDFTLLFSVLLAAGFGLIIIYSATRYSMPEGVTDPQFYLKKQGYWLIVAIVAMIIIQFFNYRVLKKYWWSILAINTAALISVLVFGTVINGTRGWINLKVSMIQPSEFSKVFMVIIVAAVLSKWPREKINHVGFKKIILSLAIAFLSIILVLREPDYGTAIIFFITYMGMLFLSGANFFYFAGILAITAGGLFAAIKLEIIKQYQLDRILVFIKPDIQQEGIGYNLFQSKLAIGSGGLFGKGLFLGKQTNLSYVPEHHTDFIFSVIGEEIGFIGAIIIIIILALIVWRCFYISSNSRNSFGALIAGGIGFIILSQVIINIGMTIGIMPIIGIPLPFLSYGGSNLLSIFIGIGLVENVYFRRDLRKDYEIAYDEFD